MQNTPHNRRLAHEIPHQTTTTRHSTEPGIPAGSGRQPRVRGWLPERQAIRVQYARRRDTGSAAIIETSAGKKCQVDYGTGPMVRDPDTILRIATFAIFSGPLLRPAHLQTTIPLGGI